MPKQATQKNIEKYAQENEEKTNLFIGLIGPIGCNRQLIIETIYNIAEKYEYKCKILKISNLFYKNKMLINSLEFENMKSSNSNVRKKCEKKINDGDKNRRKNGNSYLTKQACNEIKNDMNHNKNKTKTIYIIDSLKHEEEVIQLKNVYGNGLYLISIYSDESERKLFLKNKCYVDSDNDAEELIKQDKGTNKSYGQNIKGIFPLADFFIKDVGDIYKAHAVLSRFMGLIFGDPKVTPTFQEYAMYMAHSASYSSSNLSRQVGAVIANKDNIIATGSNDFPKAFGGTYWPIFDNETFKIEDIKDGRDGPRFYEKIKTNEKNYFTDYNKLQINKITSYIKDEFKKNIDKLKDKNNIIKTLGKIINKSGINDITEYSRSIHGEMDALLNCARRGVSTDKCILYCTTHPCHNCAKHIIASGIKKVVFIEPYPKSHAYKMHDDAMTYDQSKEDSKVLFKAFIGVGPRQYRNLFSMNLSNGYKQSRKDTKWNEKNASPRVKLFDINYSTISNYK